jgi:hypothetical protein
MRRHPRWHTWPIPVRHTASAGPAGGHEVEAYGISPRDEDADPDYGGDAGTTRLRARRAGRLPCYVVAADDLLHEGRDRVQQSCVQTWAWGERPSASYSLQKNIIGK